MKWLASRPRLLVWAAVGLLAGLLLGLFAWFDLGFFGSNPSDHPPHPYATADRVSYGLGVWRSYYQGDVLTESPTYLMLWGWAALNAALLWPLRRFAAGRVMFWGYALTLAGLLLAGVTLLPYATADHNAVLSAYPDTLPRTVDAYGQLTVKQCTDWRDSGCAAFDTSRVLNPALPGVLALLLTPALGLLAGAWEAWRERRTVRIRSAEQSLL
ncbi:hypothetical protein ACFP81_08815 [Deinococcus lacus]|uniref:DUF2567 domain-containing protein n=1 Tax=Deinococcus lacus TaxID=392561 RepID=A0ABW1YEZ3_9DEIO